jgi:phosphate/sulfate permease
MTWPVGIYLALTAAGLLLMAHKHGQPRTGTHTLWGGLFSTALVLALLAWGGFFDGLIK